jgi:hypothetical protein
MSPEAPRVISIHDAPRARRVEHDAHEATNTGPDARKPP